MSRYTGRSNGPFGPLVVGYDQQLSSEHTNVVLCTLARSLLDRLSPAGWAAGGQYIADCIVSDDLHSLCLYDPDVLDLPATDQSILYQCLAFFRKRVDIDLGLDREAAALAKFRGAEDSCKLVNHKFRLWSQGRFVFDPEVERVLHASQLKISKVLTGEGLAAPTICEIRSRFGPGATTQVPKRTACLVSKLAQAPACSTNLADHVHHVLPYVRLNEGSAVEEVDVEIHASRIAFVPKNAKTERAICTEPTLNGMFQLGIGDELARRLRVGAGIDIRDQSRNQRAALYGSISGGLATLDLSSASDTVAKLLVQHLLPSDWYDLLWMFRSAEADVAGERIVQQKISSMGNGFTFPLETLIFWAISESVVDIYRPHGRVLVYGDDIVVPTEAAVPLMRVLGELGFQPNPSKSFWTGRFRESCGKDYVDGIDVRPVFVEDALTGADVFRLRNFFYRKGDFLLSTWLENLIHPSIRTRGPDGYGDGHLIGSVFINRYGGRKGWSGFTFETWSHKPKLLKDTIIRKYLSVPPSARKADPKKHEWKKNHLPHVVRVATYLASQGGDRSPESVQYYRPSKSHLRSIAMDFVEKGAAGDVVSDPWVVPGRGELTRTKIYIFEPPRLY